MRISLHLQQGSYTLGHTGNNDPLVESHLSLHQYISGLEMLALLHAQKSTQTLSRTDSEYITNLEKLFKSLYQCV